MRWVFRSVPSPLLTRLRIREIFVLLALTACGDNHHGLAAHDDGPKPVDAVTDTGPPDAPVLPPCTDTVSGTSITMRAVATGLGDAALLVTAPVGDPRLFVVLRGGKIAIIKEQGGLVPTPFLDLSATAGGPVLAGGEQGLLGLAFHPQYHVNRTFFVFYTKRQVPTDATYPLRDVVARCEARVGEPDAADPASCVEILSIPDFASNHNGGMIEFGKDGFLYIGTGDGGSAGDPDGNGQALTDGSPTARTIALLGKLLRIDVDSRLPGKEYGIPTDNPFATGGGAPEIFARGLRNPWRWSFDSETGDLWIGDVGQGAIEEVDVVKAGELAGKNFGWDMFEGSTCFAGRTPNVPCVTAGKTFPVDEKVHGAPDQWTAVIGGQVYRGSCYPDIVGTYFYTDNGAGGLYSAKLQTDGTVVKAQLTPPSGTSYPTRPASLHADARGELYLTTVGGGVFHLEAGP